MGFFSRIKTLIEVKNAKPQEASQSLETYLIKLMDYFTEVKKEALRMTALENQAKQSVQENLQATQQYQNLAQKALQAGNEGDAKAFIGKKQMLESEQANLMNAYTAARENASKMRQLHDELVDKIEDLKARYRWMHSTTTLAETQERMNQFSGSSAENIRMQEDLAQMEAKAIRMLDEANAMAELNRSHADSLHQLASKYDVPSSSIEDELQKMKQDFH